ncbi:excisionase [Escherichia coli]|nr:excisionase [Escherichia coli]MDM4902362.1 excisionase [Escherichia coli]MDM4921833.1 excisionase [Escherichia coli]MDM4950324.1 excisionase [Escherichia coli]
MYLTLQEWNARQRRPRSLETVRRWVRECRWICPYISRHLLSLNPLQARCRRYSRGER